MTETISQQTGAKPPASFPKQAVVVIHGIGEQVPMDTIKAFVRAAWETDPNIANKEMPNPTEVWSKPDLRTGSLELRRITTRESEETSSFPNRVRTDFYELYWADLSAGSTLDAIENWIFGLLLRNPRKDVPRKVLGAWIILWLLSVGLLYLIAAPMFKPTDAILGWHPYAWTGHLPGYFGTLLGALLAYGANYLLKPYVGRIVRYTRATPENIAARKEIRERGLKLLDALHDGEYERIIVVGHSLGSILAYDLLNYFWAARLASHTVKEATQEFNVFKAVEKALADYRADPCVLNLEAYRTAQRAFGKMLRLRDKPNREAGGTFDSTHDGRWLITDLITLGSPLTHSEFLLAADHKDFEDRVNTREFSKAPPIAEVLDPKNIKPAEDAGMPLSPADKPELLSFPFETKTQAGSVQVQWQMHHAAVFAATTWTNIYDPSRLILCGDFISGPLKLLFGDAVIDINLKARSGKQSRSFTHTKYWALPRDFDPKKELPPPPVAALREALNLAGQIRPV